MNNKEEGSGEVGRIPYHMNKEIRRLIKEIEERGFTVEQGRTHIIVRSKDGAGAIASLPLTPGRGRWEQNLRSQLRKRGILA